MFTDSDVYENDSPSVIITGKLSNSIYHVNYISSTVTTDATIIHSKPVQPSVSSFHDRILHNLSIEIAHLIQVIKTSQSRKDLLTKLILDMKKSATDPQPSDDGADAVSSHSAEDFPPLGS